MTSQGTNKFPKLGNYPQDCTKEELVEYLEELIEWCQYAENKIDDLEVALDGWEHGSI